MTRGAPWWYETLWRVALPFALARLWWRGRREPGYRARIGERLGRYADAEAGVAPLIWIHAVSVGETRAALPLITAFAQRYRGYRILVTHMTAAGRETGTALFGDRVIQAWLPYDTDAAVTRFLDHFRPRFGVLVETELWPNLILCCASRRIPLFLANARLSQRSADRYRRMGRLTRQMLEALAGVSAQTNADAHRLSALGAHDVQVSGSIKFDLTVPHDTHGAGRRFRDRFGGSRPVWVAGSTRDGEEALLLDAIARSAMPRDALVILVPRHPQRFDDVAKLLDQLRIPYVRRSSDAAIGTQIRVVLGDSMGEMLAYYAAADVAFVGGTLLPLGGQNPIEPLAVGTPVVIGPSTFNFAEIARLAISAGAVLQAADADRVVAAIAGLLTDPQRRSAMAAAAATLLAAHRGAAERTASWIARTIDTDARAESAVPNR